MEGSNPLGGGPALASAAAVLKTMGIKIIRQGGSFADGSYYCTPLPPFPTAFFRC